MREAPPTPELPKRLIPLSGGERPQHRSRRDLAQAGFRQHACVKGGRCQAEPDLPTSEPYHGRAAGTIVALVRRANSFPTSADRNIELQCLFRFGLRLEKVFEFFVELFDFGADDELAVLLRWVRVEIVLGGTSRRGRSF